MTGFPFPRARLRYGASAFVMLSMFAGVSAGAAPGAAGPALSVAPAVKPYDAGWGFDQKGMDTTVKPGNDFYQYANGTYVRHLKIPDDQSSYGPFNILFQLSLARQRAILDNARLHASDHPTDDLGKLGTIYASFLDQAAVDRLGAKPLEADLQKVRAVHDPKSLAALFGAATSSFQFCTFSLGIEQDDKNPERYTLVLDQGMSIGTSGGLGLPDISYYTNPELGTKKRAYQTYVARLLTLANWPGASRNAARIVALETALAKVEAPLDQTRDSVRNYNPMTVAELEKLAPAVDWSTLLQEMGIPQKGLLQRQIVVREPQSIAAMARVLHGTDYDTLRAWLAFHLIDDASGTLSHDFSDASFDFNGRTLSGVSRQSDRWKRAVGAANGAMGWALGRIYVAQYFPPAAMQQITTLVGNVRAAFRSRLQRNAWMDAPTREIAIDKLDHIMLQVGYPREWRDYSTLDIRKGDVYGNAERGVAFSWRHALSHLDKPVDRNEWGMTPQTVNAYNSPVMNEVVFPAAILQPPFFDPKGDVAVNYGAIGGVIGHEMSHGFDDQGRHYDVHGRLHDWWTKASSDAFQKLAARLAAQFDAQEPLPGLHVNGRMTTGENIADLGGLNMGLQAYHDSLHGNPAPFVHDLTGDQRVFLGWAQVWRQKVRPDSLRRQILSNEHAPDITRVNMPVHNIDAWYTAFGVKPGDALYLSPEKRVKIW